MELKRFQVYEMPRYKKLMKLASAFNVAEIDPSIFGMGNNNGNNNDTPTVLTYDIMIFDKGNTEIIIPATNYTMTYIKIYNLERGTQYFLYLPDKPENNRIYQIYFINTFKEEYLDQIQNISILNVVFQGDLINTGQQENSAVKLQYDIITNKWITV